MIISKLKAGNITTVGGKKISIPPNSSFSLDIRDWLELKIKHKKWFEGGYIYPENEEIEKNQIDSYHLEFIQYLTDLGIERTRQKLTNKSEFTKYEINVANEWIAEKIQNDNLLKKERDEKELEVSLKSVVHAKRANIIAFFALLIGVFTLLLSIL